MKAIAAAFSDYREGKKGRREYGKDRDRGPSFSGEKINLPRGFGH
jgi:hypothetical protein